MFKKTIKAIFGAILATPIALMALADDKVTITVWSMDGHDLGNEDTHRQVIAAFEAAHPNIKIDLTLLPESGLELVMIRATQPWIKFNSVWCIKNCVHKRLPGNIRKRHRFLYFVSSN